MINLWENKIIKKDERFIKKNDALSPLRKINTSDKMKIKTRTKNTLFFLSTKNKDKPNKIGHNLDK